jgi:outer membrane protein OmpA-like peptidoglycan-associated protein
MNPGKVKLLGFLGFILLLFCCLFFKVNAIENDLSARTVSALTNNNIEVDSILLSGRDLTLKGIVASEEIKKKAGEIAENIWGVRKVNNLLLIRKITEPLPLPKDNIQKKLNEAIAIKNIEFETNKTIIRKTSYPILQKVISILKEYPEISIEIEGYTDSKGNAEHNLKLSDKRANAVMKFLVKNGIERSRLTAKGFGIKNPIADNNTEEGRQKNRRVEFKIIKEK